MAEIAWIKHLAQRVDQITQVEVIRSLRKCCKYANYSHKLASYKVALRNIQDAKDQMNGHDHVDNDDPHKQKIVFKLSKY